MGGRTGGFGWWACAWAVLLLAAAAGCSSGTVRGKVSYKGQTVGGGTVVFTVPGKGSIRSEIAEDGSYTISKCPTGTARVTVETVWTNGWWRIPSRADRQNVRALATAPIGTLPYPTRRTEAGPPSDTTRPFSRRMTRFW